MVLDKLGSNSLHAEGEIYLDSTISRAATKQNNNTPVIVEGAALEDLNQCTK